MVMITYGEVSKDLAYSLSKLTRIPILPKVVRRFPDNEVYVRIENTKIKGEVIYIVHSLYPDQNSNLIELFLTLDLVRDYGGIPRLILPYLAYSRQDKRFQEGEAFSLRTIANILKGLGVREIITIDVHSYRKEGKYRLFSIPAKNITASRLLVDYARTLCKDFIIAGPDQGSKHFLSNIEGKKVFLRKEKYCSRCGKNAVHCKCSYKKKEYEIRSIAPKSVKGKNVLIMDDIISSGGTMIEAVKAVKGCGANKIMVACTHGLFLGNSLKVLKSMADIVFSTNTIKSEVARVDVAKLLARGIIPQA
ncbi:MAG TPA: ribose-phosphate diphosphokinase [Candidatus Aenigmarchaeota archaeon]|nr:MAG: hypothetical protein DRP03_02505 [Candidatus Aenigmarchaeota archaeon]HDD45962.1 ribose-phosphate diphosphokinase [Candidatus Aenigmarchaeota archaeon]